MHLTQRTGPQELLRVTLTINLDEYWSRFKREVSWIAPLPVHPPGPTACQPGKFLEHRQQTKWGTSRPPSDKHGEEGHRAGPESQSVPGLAGVNVGKA